ncbi:MAG: zinc-ribbon domain-containing protein, partial [Myxococcota bacterium]
MIVSCPGCKARYRVRRESLAADGSRMRCPKCTTIFVAKPNEDIPEDSLPPRSITATQLQRVPDPLEVPRPANVPSSPTNPGFLDQGLGGYLDSPLVSSAANLPPVRDPFSAPTGTPPPMAAQPARDPFAVAPGTIPPGVAVAAPRDPFAVPPGTIPPGVPVA